MADQPDATGAPGGSDMLPPARLAGGVAGIAGGFLGGAQGGFLGRLLGGEALLLGNACLLGGAGGGLLGLLPRAALGGALLARLDDGATLGGARHHRRIVRRRAGAELLEQLLAGLLGGFAPLAVSVLVASHGISGRPPAVSRP